MQADTGFARRQLSKAIPIVLPIVWCLHGRCGTHFPLTGYSNTSLRYVRTTKRHTRETLLYERRFAVIGQQGAGKGDTGRGTVAAGTG